MKKEEKACREWIERIVLGLNLCPFAHKPYHDDLVDLVVVSEQDPKKMFVAVLESIKSMIKKDSTELSNRFLILPDQFSSFENYLDFFYRCTDYLVEENWSDYVQLTSFHPQYVFGGMDADDVTNYTNRSPYPMIHVLRVAEVTAAIQSYGDTSQIYKNNMAKLRELGHEGLDKLK